MGEANQIIIELLWTGLSLYIVSIFIGFFDSKIGHFLKQVSYLFSFSILLIVGSNIYLIVKDLAEALNKLSESRLLGLFGGN